MKVSASGFYAWLAQPVSDRDWADAQLTNTIVDMRRAGVAGIHRRRRGGCTRRDDSEPSDDLVNRSFDPVEADRLWVMDVTEDPSHRRLEHHPSGKGRAVSDIVIDRVEAGTGATSPARPWNLTRIIRPTDAELARARRTLHLKAMAIGAVTLASYWVLVISSTTFAVRLVSAVVLTAALTAVATSIMHDANHGAFSRSRRVNRLMGYSLDLLGGSSWMWRHRHNIQHHVSTNVVGVDKDIDQAPFARLAPQQAWRPWHRYQHLYLWPVYGLLALRWLVGDLITLARDGNDSPPPHPCRARAVSLVVLGKLLHLGWAVVIPLALHPWWAVAGFYLAISWCIGLFAALIFQMAHCVEDAEFVSPEADHRGRHFQLHQLRTTLDVRCPVPGLRHVVRFMMGGLDHQIEHHLAPGLPHTIYPVLAERLAAACATHSLPYRSHGSITAALRSHVRWLKLMGSEAS